MAQLTLIPAATAAVTAKAPCETAGYAGIVVSANNLAGAEEVAIFINSGGSWVVAVDSTGTAIKLTATAYILDLVAGPTYGFTKDATAGACGVFVDLRNLS